jgi:hypothetical protein
MFVAMGETILQAGVSSTLKTPPNEKLSILAKKSSCPRCSVVKCM